MAATLTSENQVQIPATTIDAAKVAAIKIEDNAEAWIELWIIFGLWVEGEFVEYHDPSTGQPPPPLYIKLEMGAHPLMPGTALRKCPTCGKWFQLETVCDVPECEGVALVPYDGFLRACFWETSSNQPRNCLKEAIYEFLNAEIIPDPVTWEERSILGLDDWS